MKESELRGEQVFRSSSARTLAVVWFAVAAFVAFDAVRRGSGRSLWIGLAVVALVSALVYALAYRPAVAADDEGITIRNIVRDVRIPWARVEHIGAKWSLTIDAAGRTWASWAITARNRQRAAVPPALGLGGPAALGSGSLGAGPRAGADMDAGTRAAAGARRGLPGGRASRLRVGDPGPVIPAPATTRGGEYVSAQLAQLRDEAQLRGTSAPGARDEVTVEWAWSPIVAIGAAAAALAIALLA
jgi:hypothetical protein